MPPNTAAKILLIEDNQMHRYLYVFEFRKQGFNNFRTAATAKEGLTSVKSDPPDLILLDLVLEGTIDMDGLEVLRRLKADPATAKIPVIILSNKREKDMAQEVKSLGAAGYLLKAKYQPREIVERVEQFLTSRAK